MNRRLLILFSVVFVILVAGSITVVLLVHRNPKLQNTIYKLANVNAPATNTPTNVAVKNTNATAEASRAQISLVARNFAEIYGSGSNQNNGSNLTEAQAYTTASYSQYLRSVITENRLTQPTSPYHGFVTKALVIQLTKLTSTTATVLVGTQRQETTGTQTKTYTQNLEIDFIKVSGAWKVNAAAWKSK